MSISETISPLIGRWALAWFYLMAARHAAQDWSEITAAMAARTAQLLMAAARYPVLASYVEVPGATR